MVIPIPWEQAYIARYILEVPSDGIVDRLTGHFREARKFFEAIPGNRADFFYAEGKWTVRQLLGHIVDSQVIFGYRALCFSRGETKPLPGYEENDYAAHWGRNDIPLEDVSRCYSLQSEVVLAQAGGLTSRELDSPGVANGIGLSALQVYRALIGHERHHLKILAERYGVGQVSKIGN